MNLQRFLARWFLSPRSTIRRPAPGRKRPHLEVLEDRLAPATLTVNSLADTANPNDPFLSLREAIAIVNSPTLPTDLSDQILGQISGTLHEAGTDTIRFDQDAVRAAITLGGRQLELTLPSDTATITIDGGETGVTLDGNNASRVLRVDRGAEATLEHLTVTHGVSTAGGGIFNDGTVTMSDCTLVHNISDEGGGIDNFGTMTVSSSTLDSNTSGDLGAGIFNRGTLTLSDSTLSSNANANLGGGILNVGTLTVSRSIFTFNSAGIGGGIANGATLTVTDSVFESNTGVRGGALENHFGIATVSGSSFHANSAIGSIGSGGAIANLATLTVSNCTMTGNAARHEGGGIFNDGTMTVSDCTVTGSAAGGGLFVGSGDVVVQNSIVAQNVDNDVSGPLDTSSSSYNLIGTGGSGGLVDGVNHNLVGVADPRLAPLGDYGGPTQTISLLPGSPALNSGDPAQLGTPDQRGVVRTGGVNIGAFQASAASFVLSAPASVRPGEAFDITVAVIDSFGQLAVGYTGTIHFSTSDPDARVVLPPDFTFGLGNGGAVTFSGGVSLFTPGSQTLTATDPDSGITGSTVVLVVEPGEAEPHPRATAGRSEAGPGRGPSLIPPRARGQMIGADTISGFDPNAQQVTITP
jgi:hypothetical protein